MSLEELDLRILKAIITDKVNALSFSYKYDHTLFDSETERFAKLVLDYTKHFRSPPTRRTLLDRHKGNSNLSQIIESAWDELDEFEYDNKEFTYDLGELKKRFQKKAVEIIRDKAEVDESSLENPEEYFHKLSLEISRVVSLDLERTHTQKAVGDYVDEFADLYESRKQNPEDFPEIQTGYSLIDSAFGGFAPGELVIVGAETGGGKALSVDTPIPTPRGWTTMGELKVGDLVLSDSGEPCKVIATSGIMTNHKCYELEFSDGSKVVADAGHLWKTYTEKYSSEFGLYTSEEIFRGINSDIKTNHFVKLIYWATSSFILMITSVREVPSVPVQCIQVDAVSNCFLCGKGMIPTHNSMLLNNMAKQIWLQDNTLDTPPDQFQRGYNILYFSLEMPYQDCFIRFLASLANVPQKSLLKSCLTPEEEIKVNKAYGFIKKYQEHGHYFDIVDVPRNLTIEEVELRYHDALLRYRPDIVVIDYMGLMHSTAFAKEQDWLKMGAIAASLHEFARAYDCTTITAAQLTDLKRSSTGSQEESRRVGVHRWGRSSLIMHNVNLGIQIETRANEVSFPDLKIHLVKNRKGPLGQGNLIKNFANASLVDVPYDPRDLPGDISSNIPALIRSIQEAKNKAKES